MRLTKRLLWLARKHWGTLSIALAGVFGAALLNLVTPEIVRRLVANLDAGYFNENVLFTYVIILIAAYGLRAVCRFVGLAISHVAAWKFVADCTLEVYDKLQRLSMRYYQSKRTGELMSRAINDTRQAELLIAHAFPDFISNLLIVAGVTVMLFSINAKLALLMMIPAPFVVFVSTLFSKKVAPMFRTNQRVLGELNGIVQDNFSGMKEIQSFTQEQSMHKEMSVKCDEYSLVNIRANYASALYHPGIELLTSLGTVIVIGVGGLMAMRGDMPVADIVGFVMYLSLFYAPLTVLMRLMEDVQVTFAGAVRIFEILDEVPEVRDAPDAVDLQHCEGSVTFENVSFRYTEDAPILDNINFTIKPGEMAAFVGPTGSGKTTITLLLERFYEPLAGTVKMDGMDIRKLTLQSVRSQVSMVFQDTFLFNGTVAENIAFGVPDATPEKIREAARAANADTFISAMPDGYQTMVGERGARLSGGQKQRIAIARAVLRNTPILIFDEATSAVDSDTEREIQTAINKLAGSRTIIIIAHRLSTVVNANNIYVIENGRITETGNHTQLLEQEGLYARLYKIQLNA